MSVYNVNGDTIRDAYDVNGDRLTQAYDINGNPLFDEVDLTLASYNIGQWYNGSGVNVPTAKYATYYTLQRETLSSIGADIIAFQEYWDPFSSGHPVADVIGEYFTDNYAYTSGGTYNKKAIYANGYTISDGTFHTFAAGTEGYLKAAVDVGGRTVWIINAHLATSSNESRKVAEAAELMSIVENLEYFIIFGDFNTGGGYTTAAPEYTTIMKQFVDAGYDCANFTDMHGFHRTYIGSADTTATGAACDHIITSPNIVINSVTVKQQKITTPTGDTIDHMPIVAEVTIE